MEMEMAPSHVWSPISYTPQEPAVPVNGDRDKCSFSLVIKPNCCRDVTF